MMETVAFSVPRMVIQLPQEPTRWQNPMEILRQNIFANIQPSRTKKTKQRGFVTRSSLTLASLLQLHS